MQNLKAVIEKAQILLGFQPETGLRQGLKATAELMKEYEARGTRRGV
jgi:nucleoside-diphosphate-sugar epimerase